MFLGIKELREQVFLRGLWKICKRKPFFEEVWKKVGLWIELLHLFLVAFHYHKKETTHTSKIIVFNHFWGFVASSIEENN